MVDYRLVVPHVSAIICDALSTTDPESRMARKIAGKEGPLCLSSHVLMENRHSCSGSAVHTSHRHRGTRRRAGHAARAMWVLPGPMGIHPLTRGLNKGYSA